MASKKRLLLIFRHPPYGNTLARAGLDVALATAAFEQNISILFMDDGVYQLLPGQDSAVIEQKNHRRQLDSLPLYDIDTLYVEQASLDARQIAPQAIADKLELLDNDALQQLLQRHDQVLSF